MTHIINIKQKVSSGGVPLGVDIVVDGVVQPFVLDAALKFDHKERRIVFWIKQHVGPDYQEVENTFTDFNLTME